MRQFIEPASAQLQSPVDRKLIWGDRTADAQSSGQTKVKFEGEENQEKAGKKPPENPRIKFGE
jgi:hypothetical protein